MGNPKEQDEPSAKRGEGGKRLEKVAETELSTSHCLDTMNIKLDELLATCSEIKMLKNEICESCVLNNRWSSKFFKAEQGVRQGCPLSPYLFILCVEVLAEKIRKTKDIKGIFVNQNEIKISQYADDTTLILDGKKSLTLSLQVLERFRNSIWPEAKYCNKKLKSSGLEQTLEEMKYYAKSMSA